VQRKRIFHVQGALQDNGLYTCPECKRDGKLGRATKEALKKFQRMMGLFPSGELTEETLWKLGGRALRR